MANIGGRGLNQWRRYGLDREDMEFRLAVIMSAMT
jgi:hypothetical protein